jgi:hypothetical protein
MKYDSSQNLSHCPFSRLCIHFLDELDMFYFLPQKAPFTPPEQPLMLDDPLLLEQLRVHVPTCSICTGTLSSARRLSLWQRGMMRKLLAESERLVPSSTRRIVEAIRLKPR